MPKTIEDRVDRLERELLIWRAIALACLAISGFVLVRHAGIPGELVTGRVRIVNPHGQHGATLAATDDGFVSLSFTDLHGVDRVTLLMTPSGKPTLLFSDGRSSRLDIGVVDGFQPGAEEFSIRLRQADGTTLWIPAVTNAWADRSVN